MPAVPINAPLIFQPPPALTGGVAQVWVGASGINGGGGSQWGGANVYISIDNVTYSQIAVLTAPMRQGFLTASIPAAGGWDAVDTLSVNLAESGGTLSGTSQRRRSRARRCRSSIRNSSPTRRRRWTPAIYNLTGLARGWADRIRRPLDRRAVRPPRRGGRRYDLPANFVGHTLYFKFQSFNVFGGGAEDLSTCAVYSFTPPAASSPSHLAQRKPDFLSTWGK